jgi:hypothetical protein
MQNPLKTGRMRAALVGILFVVTTLLFFVGLDLWLRIAIIVAAGILYALAADAEIRKIPRIQVEELLALMTKSIYGSENAHSFRAGVMIWNQGASRLQMKHRFNMEGARDRNAFLRLGEGCAGRAFVQGVPVVHNVSAAGKKGIYRDVGLVWPDMRALVCIPIPKADGDGKLGVLCVATKLEFEDAGFADDGIITALSTYADLIGRIMT